MNSQAINSLSEFLLQAGTEYLVFDMGRGINLLDAQRFLELENNESPAPYPRNGNAWFGIVFWNKQLNNEHYIWFVKLPIDEQGLLNRAARNQFLEIIVTALGSQLEYASERQAELPENPFVFTPSQQQMADFNALTKQKLGIAKQLKTASVAQYINAPTVQDWRKLAVQDISDYCVLTQNDKTAQLAISKSLSVLAPEFLHAMFNSLENLVLCDELINEIIVYRAQQQDPKIQAMALRSISQHTLSPPCQSLLTNIVTSDNNDVDTLVVIAGRHWQWLILDNNLMMYMQKVAIVDNSYALFKGIYSDLVQLPTVRASMLSMLRLSDKPIELTHAIGSLLSNYSSNKGAST